MFDDVNGLGTIHSVFIPLAFLNSVGGGGGRNTDTKLFKVLRLEVDKVSPILFVPKQNILYETDLSFVHLDSQVD